MQNQSHSFPTVPLLVVTSLVAGMVAWSRHNAAPSVPVAVIAGVDSSDSVRDKNASGGTLLGQSRSALSQLNAGLNSSTDFLLLMRVDRQTTPFFQSAPLSGSEKMLDVLMTETQPSASRSGTFPAKFWTLAAQQAASPQLVPGRSVAVTFYSDGDCDDLSPASDSAIAAAAKQLARNPRVSGVWIFGIKRENWTKLSNLFASLGGRLHLATKTQMSPSPLLQELDAVRRAASQGTSNKP